MSTEIKIHPIQAQILRNLLFAKSASFAALNNTELTNDHFTFHIKRLVQAGLLEKNKKGLYRLSIKGKEFANRFDTETSKVERQPKVTMLIGCVSEGEKGTEYLFQQRLKQPFYGFYGFVSGKVRWGSTIVESAARELYEETGLKASTLQVMGVEHKMDYSDLGELLEDKIFFVVKATGLKGKLLTTFEGGKNVWLNVERLGTLDKVFADVKDILDIFESQKCQIVEKKFTEKGY